MKMNQTKKHKKKEFFWIKDRKITTTAIINIIKKIE
jgi:hypothetical protein